MSTSIDTIASSIQETIDTARPPQQDLPPFYVTIEDKYRPGLSAIALTSNIVSRLGEAGIDTATLPNGDEPQIVKFVRIICEEVIKEIQLNAKIMVEIPVGVTTGIAAIPPANVPVVSAIPIQGAGLLL